MAEKTGHCLCGAVSFRAMEMGKHFSTCHCKSCQRWVGSALKGISVKPDNLTIEGRENIGVYQSSEFAERAFCKKCGSAIWFRLTAGKYAGNISLPVGLLDEPNGLTMTHEYFADCKNTTDLIPDDRIQVTTTDVEKIVADFMAEDQK